MSNLFQESLALSSNGKVRRRRAIGFFIFVLLSITLFAPKPSPWTSRFRSAFLNSDPSTASHDGGGQQ